MIYRQRLMLVNGYQSRMVCQQIVNKVQNRSHLGRDDYVMGPLSSRALLRTVT